MLPTRPHQLIPTSKHELDVWSNKRGVSAGGRDPAEGVGSIQKAVYNVIKSIET